jgi:hypothetical protein
MRKNLIDGVLVGCSIHNPGLDPEKDYGVCGVFYKDITLKTDGVKFQRVTMLNADGESLEANLEPAPANSGWNVVFEIPPSLKNNTLKFKIEVFIDNKLETTEQGGGSTVSPDGVNIEVPPTGSTNGHYFFISSLSFMPSEEFSNIDQADRFCQILASDSEIEVIRDQSLFMAVISDSQNSARDRLTIDGTILNTRGDEIFNGDEGEFFQGMNRKNNQDATMNENGDQEDNNVVWTGTLDNDDSDEETCGDWNLNDGNDFGETGRSDQDGTNFMEDGDRSCDNSYHFYCISQDKP